MILEYKFIYPQRLFPSMSLTAMLPKYELIVLNADINNNIIKEKTQNQTSAKIGVFQFDVHV